MLLKKPITSLPNIDNPPRTEHETTSADLTYPLSWIHNGSFGFAIALEHNQYVRGSTSCCGIMGEVGKAVVVIWPNIGLFLFSNCYIRGSELYLFS